MTFALIHNKKLVLSPRSKLFMDLFPDIFELFRTTSDAFLVFPRTVPESTWHQVCADMDENGIGRTEMVVYGRTCIRK